MNNPLVTQYPVARIWAENYCFRPWNKLLTYDKTVNEFALIDILQQNKL